MPLRKTTRTDTGMSLACPCGAAFPSFRSMGAHARWCRQATGEVRFWHMVDKRGPDECWGWKAQKRWDGYGRFMPEPRKPEWAHRFSYRLHYGEITPGMTVMHSCDQPECTNPDHLYLGTHAENMEDMRRKGRSGTRGEKNNHAKLTEAQVREILSLHKPGRLGNGGGNTAELAKRYGVSVGNIQAISARRIWKCVEDERPATSEMGK